MRILCERVEHLEGYFPLPALHSPWLAEAFTTLTDEELDRAGEFSQLAVAGRQAEATREQWDAFAVLCREEARLKEAAVRRGQPGVEIPIIFDVWDAL